MQTTISDNEQKARELGNDRKALRHRLNSSRSCLVSELRHRFGDSKFEFEQKRLISDDGTLALQWFTRPRPDEPESYTNQQTTIGSVRVILLTAMLGASPQ